jgi:hypothetical protein
MHCYVNTSTSGAIMPRHLTLENTFFYPETGMTTYERHTSGVPRNFHIMTDAADLVALYSRHEVFIWCPKSQSWVNPDFQIYGAELDYLRRMLFNITCSIPRATVDGVITNVMGRKIKPKLTGLNGVLNDQQLSEEAANKLDSMIKTNTPRIPVKRSPRMRKATHA